jgi:hypothetical protein
MTNEITLRNIGNTYIGGIATKAATNKAAQSILKGLPRAWVLEYEDGQFFQGAAYASIEAAQEAAGLDGVVVRLEEN